MSTAKTRQSIVVAAAPGMLRNALQNLFSTLPSVGTLVLTGDLASLTRAVQQHAPALVVLDADFLADEAESVESVMATKLAGAALLILVTDVEQQQLFSSHWNHEVLFKGVHPEVLYHRVETILRSVAT